MESQLHYIAKLIVSVAAGKLMKEEEFESWAWAASVRAFCALLVF